MNILLSAYACEPNKGSEPGVGWNWAIQIANRGHNVFVLTRKNNRKSIEEFSQKNDNIKFFYYDLPLIFIYFKKYFGLNTYYFIWQFGLYFKARNICKCNSIDVIHHITFVSFKKYSFLFLLRKPFYYGPLGGGEQPTLQLLKILSFKNKLYEYLRILLNYFIKFNLISYYAFKKSRIIFVTTSQTYEHLNNCFKKKTIVSPAIGIDLNHELNIEMNYNQNEPIRFLYVGQFLHWKGIQISLLALSKLKSKGYDFVFTIVGEGKYKQEIIKLIRKHNLINNVTVVKWLARDDLREFYQSHDIFLFPSLHDSGGMVVLEAMNNYLPVMCLDIGGPAFFVNNENGFVISTYKKPFETILDSYYNLLLYAINNPLEIVQKSNYAHDSIHEFLWSNTVERVYKHIEHDFKLINSLP